MPWPSLFGVRGSKPWVALALLSTQAGVTHHTSLCPPAQGLTPQVRARLLQKASLGAVGCALAWGPGVLEWQPTEPLGS